MGRADLRRHRQIRQHRRSAACTRCPQAPPTNHRHLSLLRPHNRLHHADGTCWFPRLSPNQRYRNHHYRRNPAPDLLRIPTDAILRYSASARHGPLLSQRCLLPQQETRSLTRRPAASSFSAPSFPHRTLRQAPTPLPHPSTALSMTTPPSFPPSSCHPPLKPKLVPFSTRERSRHATQHSPRHDGPSQNSNTHPN